MKQILVNAGLPVEDSRWYGWHLCLLSECVNNCAYFHHRLEFPFESDVDYTISNNSVWGSCDLCASSISPFSGRHSDKEAQVSGAISDNTRPPRLAKNKNVSLQMAQSWKIRTQMQLWEIVLSMLKLFTIT